jgi:hypothetical protein
MKPWMMQEDNNKNILLAVIVMGMVIVTIFFIAAMARAEEACPQKDWVATQDNQSGEWAWKSPVGFTGYQYVTKEEALEDACWTYKLNVIQWDRGTPNVIPSNTVIKCWDKNGREKFSGKISNLKTRNIVVGDKCRIIFLKNY